ncbi:sensor domain-containing diguanylate cyclase [Shewanella sp. HN-41]|uniref:sensor domain-containing diguanylate cyclase n=1 Tax=Shewanella sp. HN-41 TaxID=327275 RepID=UPI0002125AA3|nr:diguanylate cyclase [Shewanella sp. HN-41]EGM68244.1 putative signaling protein [Shewanella sp. HN-41]
MARTTWVGLITFWALLLTGISFTATATTSVIKWQDETASLTDFPMGYFVDHSGNMSFNEVMQQTFVDSSNRVSLGTSALQTWAKIQLINPSDTQQKLYLHHPYAYHNRQVGLYEMVDGQETQRRILDLDDPSTYGWIYGGAAVFEITLAPQQKKTLYVESVSFSHQWFSIDLYNKEQSQRALLGSFTDIAVMVGMLLALIIYNLLLFMYSRQRDNLFYACYLISGGIWIALSYGLVAELFQFYGSASLYWHLTLMTMPIFLILFMMDIFETRQHYRFEHYALVFVLTLLVAEFCYGVVDIIGALRYSSSLAALMMLTTLTVTISLVMKRHPIAKYFLLGHCLFVGFSGLAVMFYKGRAEFSYLSSHGVGVGIMLEALVLALIIAYRIRLLEEIKASQEELKYQAATDSLTHLFNRRYFHREAELAFTQAKIAHQPMAIIICDIDLFKQINDTYGHLEGDKVIFEIAQTLKHHARRGDIVARYGGEEFIMLLQNVSLAEANLCAERIRVAANKLTFTVEDEQEFNVTLSLGVAAVAFNSPLEYSVKLADNALYKAKHNGRNNVYSSAVEMSRSPIS